MKKIKYYTVAQGQDISELNTEVYNRMHEGRGYVPYGSGYFDGKNYCQPMVEYEKIKFWKYKCFFLCFCAVLFVIFFIVSKFI